MVSQFQAPHATAAVSGSFSTGCSISSALMPWLSASINSSFPTKWLRIWTVFDTFFLSVRISSLIVELFLHVLTVPRALTSSLRAVKVVASVWISRLSLMFSAWAGKRRTKRRMALFLESPPARGRGASIGNVRAMTRLLPRRCAAPAAAPPRFPRCQAPVRPRPLPVRSPAP